MKLLTNEQLKSNENAKKNYIHENIEDKHAKYKKYYKFSARSTYNMKYDIPKSYSGWGQKKTPPPTSIPPGFSTNVAISSQKFLTFATIT